MDLIRIIKIIKIDINMTMKKDHSLDIHSKLSLKMQGRFIHKMLAMLILGCHRMHPLIRIKQVRLSRRLSEIPYQVLIPRRKLKEIRNTGNNIFLHLPSRHRPVCPSKKR